ncbi:CKLF-like MARVEL transmembrane domain-containing protein 7 [Contarinia nasturtii]|uniref:CKLF-like MARVEL transmembrane domain-containing protein 7 n=1 Tax=Contarinia nasturtii TaxID=265458 RepID=UPI0012D3A4DD|nr:CKLF-like MARVEL transmembrane domain-containing protein 7 [Contarinia nasturtii]
MDSMWERLRTVPAILKILCLIFEIAGFICTKLNITGSWGASDFFWTIAILAFIPTTILLVLYLIKADNIFGVYLDTIELYFSVIAAIGFLVISSLIVVTSLSLLIAGAIFGYLAMVVYAVDAFLRYRERA